jgi:hypothetical protein
MATPGQMPMCNEQSVPSFDLTRLRELVCYFEDLEDHFSHCTITDLANRKKLMLKYVPMQVADLWESLSEWTSATDWATLKTAIQKCYLKVSLYLIRQSHLSTLEQHRYLLESLSTNLHQEVSAHMCNVNPTCNPEEVEEVS